MLALCVIPTTMMQMKLRIRNTPVRKVILGILAVFTAFMVIGRLLSGVHWLSDIVGGVLLSMGLAALYAFACKKLDHQLRKQTKENLVQVILK